MDPLVLTRFTMNVRAKNKASVINPRALYRSVLPVYRIRKKRDIRKIKVIRKAMAFSEVDRSGGPPAIKIRIIRIMGNVSRMDFQILPSVQYTFGFFI